MQTCPQPKFISMCKQHTCSNRNCTQQTVTCTQTILGAGRSHANSTGSNDNDKTVMGSFQFLHEESNQHAPQVIVLREAGESKI